MFEKNNNKEPMGKRTTKRERSNNRYRGLKNPQLTLRCYIDQKKLTKHFKIKNPLPYKIKKRMK